MIRAKFVYDAMGRVTGYSEYNAAGSAVVYSRTAVYDAASLVASDVVTTVRTDGTYVASTAYDYKLLSGSTYTGAYNGGAVTHSRTTTTKNGSSQPTSDTVNSFVWWDTAQQAGITYTPNISSPSTTNTTTYNYDITGALSTVSIYDGRPRTVTFVNNSSGEVMSRDEADANTATGDPHERRYYFAGLAVGDVSNNGTSDTDYAVSIATHTTVPGTGAFRNGSTTSVSYADFDQSYNPINGGNYASASTHYTVAAGDTLASIAQTVWGDSSLWYVIADANGLSLDDSLSAGQTLSIPNKVEDLHNNANTFKVYDPNAAIGSTFPNVPKPQHSNNCGGIGQILLAVIAVVVTIVTYGAAVEFAAGTLGLGAGSLGSTIVGGALAGAAGSVVSQTVGVATGIQSSFNWGAVALAAIGGGVGGGLSGSFGSLGTVGGAIARGVVGSVITQGIGVATGLQKSFDWAGVAAAGIGAGVASYASEELPGAGDEEMDSSLSQGTNTTTIVGQSFGNTFISGMAGNIANAATRTLINGSDFGDNIIAALPDTIGQTVGSLFEGGIQGAGQTNVAQAGKVSNDDLTGFTGYHDPNIAVGDLPPLVDNEPMVSGATLVAPSPTPRPDTPDISAASDAGYSDAEISEYLGNGDTFDAQRNMWVDQNGAETVISTPGLTDASSGWVQVAANGPLNGIFNGSRSMSPGQRIANFAHADLNSTRYEPRDPAHYAGYQCNIAVANWIQEAGLPKPLVPYTDLRGAFGFERIPSAAEWANPNIPIDNWSAPEPLSVAIQSGDLEPGDIIAQQHGTTGEGHVGVVYADGQTISVSDRTQPAGIVNDTDWGFRPYGQNGEQSSNDPPVMVRHYIGPSH